MTSDISARASRAHEDAIERRVARMFDRLDARLMNGDIDQDKYDAAARDIDSWAERQFDAPASRVASIAKAAP